MFEVPVPHDWVGKSVGHLNIRKKYGINIIGVTREGRLELSISTETVLEQEETMLVLGRYRELQRCFRI